MTFYLILVIWQIFLLHNVVCLSLIIFNPYSHCDNAFVTHLVHRSIITFEIIHVNLHSVAPDIATLTTSNNQNYFTASCDTNNSSDDYSDCSDSDMTKFSWPLQLRYTEIFPVITFDMRPGGMTQREAGKYLPLRVKKIQWHDTNPKIIPNH